MKRRTPIRRVSKKRIRLNAEYSRVRKVFLEAHPTCMAWSTIRKHLLLADVPPPPATDIHHVAKRGKNLLNTETWLAVCRASHDWIHNHHGVARQLGLLQ